MLVTLWTPAVNLLRCLQFGTYSYLYTYPGAMDGDVSQRDINWSSADLPGKSRVQQMILESFRFWKLHYIFYQLCLFTYCIWRQYFAFCLVCMMTAWAQRNKRAREQIGNKRRRNKMICSYSRWIISESVLQREMIQVRSSVWFLFRKESTGVVKVSEGVKLSSAPGMTEDCTLAVHKVSVRQ